jgi:hypothetical protein
MHAETAIRKESMQQEVESRIFSPLYIFIMLAALALLCIY